jgi:hypothetical protein
MKPPFALNNSRHCPRRRLCGVLILAGYSSTFS